MGWQKEKNRWVVKYIIVEFGIEQQKANINLAITYVIVEYGMLKVEGYVNCWICDQKSRE